MTRFAAALAHRFPLSQARRITPQARDISGRREVSSRTNSFCQRRRDRAVQAPAEPPVWQPEVRSERESKYQQKATLEHQSGFWYKPFNPCCDMWHESCSSLEGSTAYLRYTSRPYH